MHPVILFLTLTKFVLIPYVALMAPYGLVCLAAQTGSGKTFTMGSSFSPESGHTGVIPRVMDTVFERIAAAPDASFMVRTQNRKHALGSCRAAQACSNASCTVCYPLPHIFFDNNFP